MDIYSDTGNRSILKTLSYRVIGAVITALIVFAFTGKLALAIGVGTISLIATTILYYLHENLWAFIDSRKSKPQ
jgi:adenylylsulfate kinase